MPCAPAPTLSSAALSTLGIPIFREILSNATLFRFTLSRVMDRTPRARQNVANSGRPLRHSPQVDCFGEPPRDLRGLREPTTRRWLVARNEIAPPPATERASQLQGNLGREPHADLRIASWRTPARLPKRTQEPRNGSWRARHEPSEHNP